MNRYKVLILFIIFAIALFFIIQFVAGIIYASSITNDILGQFTNAIDVTTKAIGVYLLILFSMAIVGLLLSRKNKKPEYDKGFRFSLVFCGVISIVYLIILFS